MGSQTRCRHFFCSLIAIVALFHGCDRLRKRAGVEQSFAAAKLLTHEIKRGNLIVSVIEQGVLESSKNHEVKCKVRGNNTVIWVVESGTKVKKGDVLVRLDTLQIEDAINERSKFAHWSRSGAENSAAQVARAKLAVKEFEEGRFVMQLVNLEKQLALVESNLRVQENLLGHARKKAERGFSTEREVEQREFALEQAKLDLELKKNEIEVLKTYTKKIRMKSLEGDLKAAEATHAANSERAILDEARRDQAIEEFELCVIKAERDGMVIYPSAAAWKETPDVAEGATVHKDQVLLLMPDLTAMQVKVGIHESIVDRVEAKLKAKITIPDGELIGEVVAVASVARPAGWWTGNMVKYDTIVSLPNRPGLKPGMSAEVEVVIAEHEDVVLIPVSAVLQSEVDAFCWVVKGEETTRRKLELGDSNDVYIQVREGISEGETVVLNPVASVREAQDLALKAIEQMEAAQKRAEEEAKQDTRVED